MEGVFREARQRYADRDWEGTIAVLDGIEADEVNRLELAYLLGLAHARLEHWDEALLFLEEVVTGSDEFLKVCQCRLSLAYIYAVTGRNRLAEYEFGRLVSFGFESVQTFAGLGYAAWAQGKREDASRWYARALEIDPENANALNGLGYVLAEEGKDGGRALSCCRKAVDKFPNNPAYLDSLGWAYFRLGYLEEARTHIAQALSLAPGEEVILEHARALAGGSSAEVEDGLNGGAP